MIYWWKFYFNSQYFLDSPLTISENHGFSQLHNNYYNKVFFIYFFSYPCTVPNSSLEHEIMFCSSRKQIHLSKLTGELILRTPILKLLISKRQCTFFILWAHFRTDCMMFKSFQVMKKTHYYLVDTSVVTPGAAVSELQFNLIREEPFVVNDLKVFINLPVSIKLRSFFSWSFGFFGPVMKFEFLFWLINCSPTS